MKCLGIFRNLFKILGFLSMMLFLLVGCSVLGKPCYSKETSANSAKFPAYIGRVFPFPNSTYRHTCYTGSLSDNAYPENRGINVSLVVSEVDTDPINSFDTLIQRINLTVDKKPVDRSSMFDLFSKGEIRSVDQPEKSAPQLIVIGWGPELGTGKHNAVLTINRDDGQILVYEWEFILTK